MKKYILRVLVVVLLISVICETSVYAASKNKWISNKAYQGTYDATKPSDLYGDDIGVGYTLKIHKISKNKVKFDINFVNNSGRIAGTNTVVAKINKNKVKFRWKEIYQHEGECGTGVLIFSKKHKVKFKLTDKKAGWSMSLDTNKRYVTIKRSSRKVY